MATNSENLQRIAHTVIGTRAT